MDRILIIAASLVWSHLWGAFADRLYLGTDIFSLSFHERKLRVTILQAVVRSFLWMFFLSVGNFVLVAATCGEFSFSEVLSCLRKDSDLEVFVTASYIIPIVHSLLSIATCEVP